MLKAYFCLQHCISLQQSAIDSDVTVLRRDPALVFVFPYFETTCSHGAIRYTSQTAHDVKKRRVEIEEEERLRTFASSGAVPVPRVQKPAPSSVKPPSSKGISAKDVSFKDGNGCFTCLVIVSDTHLGRLSIDGFRFEKGCAVKLRSGDSGHVVSGRLVGINITDCELFPCILRCVCDSFFQVPSKGTMALVTKCESISFLNVTYSVVAESVNSPADCCRIFQKAFKN
jgi:hypothetical protein